jgi:hypothetical protein
MHGFAFLRTAALNIQICTVALCIQLFHKHCIEDFGNNMDNILMYKTGSKRWDTENDTIWSFIIHTRHQILG